MSNTPDITSTKKLPITKRSSVLDFTYLSLDELESEVVKLFPKDKFPEGKLHIDLLSALPFRMISNGWSKEELLEFFTEMTNDAFTLLKELEEEQDRENA